MDETGSEILLGLICLLALPVGWWLWQVRRVRNARGWPSTEATIQSADLEVASSYRRGVLKLRVFSFSYKVNEEYYSGRFTLVPNMELEESPIKQMIGRKLKVRYDPRRPSVYFLPEDIIDGCEVKQKMDPHLVGIYTRD